MFRSRKSKSLRARTQNPTRHRRLLFEQCEPRRLLAEINDDPPFIIYQNQQLVVTAENGPWANDTFVQPGCVDPRPGYQQQEGWHDPVMHYAGDWHAGDPGYAHEEDELHPGYWDIDIWHDPWCAEEGLVPMNPDDATGGILSWPPGTLTPSVSEQGARAFTYSPPTNFTGTVYIEHSIQDGHNSDSGTITIIVRPPNVPPQAINDTYSANEDVPKVVGAPGVLGNDTDGNPNDPRTAIRVDGPFHGTLTLNPDERVKGVRLQ